MDSLVGYIHGQKLLDTHINKTYWIFTWQTFWIHTSTRLVGLHTLNKTYWIYTWIDLLDTYMDKNSWVHTLTRLIGFIH